MVRDVIARAEAKAAKDKEAARNAAEGDTQGPVDAEAFIVARTPVMEPRNEARTGGRRGRGPRRRGSPLAMGTIKVEPSMVGGSESPGRARGRGRGGRPRGSRASRGGRASVRGGKRKRSSDEDDENDDSDASETFAPLPTQSRSGRKIFQANTNTPIIKVDDEGTLAGPSPLLLLQPTLTVLDKGNKKRRRTPGATAVCKNCGRGHSPASNVIAFCDGCNTPWHQHCHDPPIKSDIVQIEEKEWFCADCTVLREESQRLAGRVAREGMSFAEVCIGIHWRGISGGFVSHADGVVQKRQYLQTLPHEHLVSLLLHASALYPALPIFEPKANAAVNTASSAEGLVDVEDYYEEEMELPYPKAGNGIVLPPESDDLAFMLDDDTAAFSHSWVDASAPCGFVGMAGPALAVGA